jgi:hypothetical protein
MTQECHVQLQRIEMPRRCRLTGQSTDILASDVAKTLPIVCPSNCAKHCTEISLGYQSRRGALLLLINELRLQNHFTAKQEIHCKGGKGGTQG